MTCSRGGPRRQVGASEEDDCRGSRNYCRRASGGNNHEKANQRGGSIVRRSIHGLVGRRMRVGKGRRKAQFLARGKPRGEGSDFGSSCGGRRDGLLVGLAANLTQSCRSICSSSRDTTYGVSMTRGEREVDAAFDDIDDDSTGSNDLLEGFGPRRQVGVSEGDECRGSKIYCRRASGGNNHEEAYKRCGSISNDNPRLPGLIGRRIRASQGKRKSF